MAEIGMHPAGLELVSPRGEDRGFVEPKRANGRAVLEDFWVMQGSLCDLRCKHCYTGSSPSANHLEQIAFDELKPHLADAGRFGVTKIWFSGGEVFVNEDVLLGRAGRNEEFLRSLEFALEIAPVEILTNGRRHIRNHFDALARLRERHGERLILRITLESPGAEVHDALRGRGTFAQTVETVRLLIGMGFVPVITAERPMLDGRTDEQIRDQYRALFGEGRVEVNLIENWLEMGNELVAISQRGTAPKPEVFVTTNCFTILGKPAESLMCHSSRCVQKVGGRLRYYPCPVIYGDLRFDLGGTLEESLRRVYIAHKNCYEYCLKGTGATCRTRVI